MSDISWFKVDDKLWGHPKWLATPLRSRGLWVTAGAWSADQEQDGKIPKHVLPIFGATVRDASSLVTIGLWEVVGQGNDTYYLFHDWAEFQPLREAKDADREAARERMRAGRERKAALRSEDVRPNITEVREMFGTCSEDVRSTPSRPVPKEKNSSSATPPREDVELLCKTLHERVTGNGSKASITKTWRDAARKLLDLDSRPLEQALALIEWCQDDEFWRANVMSMPKFRSKYDQLRLKSTTVQGAVAMADVDEWLRQMFRDGTVKPIEARSGLRLPDEYQPEDDTSTAKEWQIQRRRTWITTHHDQIIAAIKEREK